MHRGCAPMGCRKVLPRIHRQPRFRQPRGCPVWLCPPPQRLSTLKTDSGHARPLGLSAPRETRNQAHHPAAAGLLIPMPTQRKPRTARSGAFEHIKDGAGHLHSRGSLCAGVQGLPEALVHRLAEGVPVELVGNPPAAQHPAQAASFTLAAALVKQPVALLRAILSCYISAMDRVLQQLLHWGILLAMHDHSCMHPQRVRWDEKQQTASHRPAPNKNSALKTLTRLLHKSVCTRRFALTAQVTRRLKPQQSLSSEGGWLPQLHR